MEHKHFGFGLDIAGTIAVMEVIESRMEVGIAGSITEVVMVENSAGAAKIAERVLKVLLCSDYQTN